MKRIRTGLLIAAGFTAAALPTAASARPHHHHHHRAYSGLGYGYSPYGYAAYGYSPYGYGYSPYSYGYSPYGYYGLSRHQRHHIRDAIHDQQDHMYGLHNHHH